MVLSARHKSPLLLLLFALPCPLLLSRSRSFPYKHWTTAIIQSQKQSALTEVFYDFVFLWSAVLYDTVRFGNYCSLYRMVYTTVTLFIWIAVPFVFEVVAWIVNSHNPSLRTRVYLSLFELRALYDSPWSIISAAIMSYCRREVRGIPGQWCKQ